MYNYQLMSIKLKIFIDRENIIDVFNFLDQQNIEPEFDEDEIYQELVVGRKYDEIEFFLDRGVEPHKFMAFCTEDDIDVVNFLADKNEYISDNPGEFLVHLINKGSYEDVVLFINTYKGNIKELINDLEGKPLQAAAKKGNLKLIEFLFANGAKLNNCHTDPLIMAILFGKVDLMPFFIQKGSKISNIKPEHLLICLKNNHRSSVAYICGKLEDNRLPRFKQFDATECFIEAVKNSNYDVLRVLINNCWIDVDDEEYDELVAKAKSGWVKHYLELMKTKNYKNKKYDTDDDDSYEAIKVNKSGIAFKD